MKRYLKELPLWILIILPYVYLAMVWNQLPEQVPTHFNMEGNPDDWSSRVFLLLIPGGMGLFLYLLLLIIPYLDPKKKIHLMGSRYYNFRIVLTLFFAILSIYLIHVSREGRMENPNILLALIGALFVAMGNYFQTVRPNYFIGIRTPWTLENEEVWRKTHRLGGRLWVVGGLLIIIIALLFNSSLNLTISFAVVALIMGLVPVVYSFFEYRKITRAS